MNDPALILQHLATAARRDDASPPDELPAGLATRVLARLREKPTPSIWEAFSLTALSVAALITLICVLLGSPAAEPPDEAEMISNLMLESELPTLSRP